MPIILTNTASISVKTSIPVSNDSNTAFVGNSDLTELHAKRAARDALRTKYMLIRKDRPPTAYKGTKLIVDGKEVPISDSVKFLLEQAVGGQTNVVANTA